MVSHPLYQEDVQRIADADLSWNRLADHSILITGATGQIGSFLVDVLMRKNQIDGLNLHVYALGRNVDHAKMRFSEYWENSLFDFISHDVNVPLPEIPQMKNGYIIHLASNTHPLAYATDPIGTITANMIGTNNLLDFAVRHDATRFAFASSNEVYGENRGDVELFDEEYCGYIDSNTLRAGYPESKRCGEALCQAYKAQKQLDVVIPRLTRSFGPTLAKNDSKALSQFIHNAISGEDIVLKSAGSQNYSYTYVADAVSGLLTVLISGKNGEAYNIADLDCNITLKQLAESIASIAGTKVVFEVPDQLEQSGYSKATKALLNPAKLQRLGWHAQFNLREGLEHTIRVLKETV